MMTPDEYSEAVLRCAGCTCHPKRIIQELDDSGAFVIEHIHEAGCENEINSQLWHARRAGSVAADTSTFNERYERRSPEKAIHRITRRAG